MMNIQETVCTSKGHHSLAIYWGFSIVAGLLFALLLEQYNYWSYLLIIVTAILFHLWRIAGGYRVLMSGALFGASLSLYALRWLFSIREHFGVSDFTANSFIFLIITAIACTYAVCALLLSLIAKYQTNAFVLVVSFASSWFLAEWLQTWIFTGFPYLQIGYVFIDTPLVGFMPVVGSLGVSFIIASYGALLLLIVTNINSKKIVISALLCMVVTFSLGYIKKTIDFTTKIGKKNIRVINGSISKADKQTPNIVSKVVDEYIAISNQSPLPDLVIWPESSIPNSFHSIYRTKLHKEFIKLKNKAVDSIVGAHLTEMHDGINRYNVLLVGNDIDNRYYKRHRVPFGEYMPKLFMPLFPTTLLADVAATRVTQHPMVLGNAVISPNICFEIMFPALIMKDTNLIVNSGDLSWFTDDIVVKKMNRIARVRAVEAEKYLLRSDNDGNSLIIDHKGDIINQTNSKQYIDATVALRKGNTFYTLFGNLPLLVTSIVMVILCYLRLLYVVRRG